MLGAKLFFLVTGFAQQPLVRLAVGLSDFGALAQALAVSYVVDNVIISSATQGVSRAVAGAPGEEPRALRAALRVHVPLAVVVFAIAAGAAPLYAAFEHAPDVVAPLLVMAGVALLYGLYGPLIGCLNGSNRFGRQALLDVTFATLRTVGLVGFGYWFHKRGLSGVLGTCVGWVWASALIVPLAAWSTGIGKRLDRTKPRPAGVPTSGAYLRVLGPIAGAQLCTNLLMQVDLALLGRFLSDAAAGTAGGVDADAQRALVKQWVGIYRECQTFAFLPYQLLFSITLVLFPMLARARAEGDMAAVREYVARGSRLAAIFCGLLVGAVVAMPASMLAFAYPVADATQGADVLRFMALAQGAFAMLGIATTVLTSIGREGLAALLTLGAVVAVAGACAVLVPGASFGHDQLVRSAQASGMALAATLVVGGFLVKRATGAFVPAATAVRCLLGVAACVAVGLVAPRFGRLLTPVAAAAAGAAYVVVLLVTREIGKRDLGMLKALRAKRATGTA
ncbi:MAG TPA: lipopolysaccharide biosynthesis protein [Polyangiaceae bacterium]